MGRAAHRGRTGITVGRAISRSTSCPTFLRHLKPGSLRTEALFAPGCNTIVCAVTEKLRGPAWRCRIGLLSTFRSNHPCRRPRPWRQGCAGSIQQHPSSSAGRPRSRLATTVFPVVRGVLIHEISHGNEFSSYARQCFNSSSLRPIVSLERRWATTSAPFFLRPIVSWCNGSMMPAPCDS